MHTKTFQKFFLIILVTCIMIATAVYQGEAAEDDSNGRLPSCTVPVTVSMNGRDVELDQCYASEFDYDGETYTIRVFYTEDPTIQDEVGGVVQCDDDDAPSLCEHALPDCDVGDVLVNCFDDAPTQNFDTTNDNLLAIQVADQVEIVLPYYFDRNFPVIGENNDIQIQLGEDTENGWVIAPNIIYLDDEYIASDSIIKVRANVFHEAQHLIQEKYNDDVGWQTWYTEGIARTSQDRTDAGYDAATYGGYTNDFNAMLANSGGIRSNDILAAKYRATAWWTWIMDQYAIPSEQEPGLGWKAIRDFYLILDNETNHSLDAVEDYLSSEGSSFDDDFIDYTLALYAYRFNPSDPRLGFIDAEINTAAAGLSNHTIISNAQDFDFNLVVTQPRSSQYWEYTPANQCDYITFSFDDNNPSDYAFSVLTVDSGGTLQDRWTARSPEWSRTVHTTGLSRVMGVITALDGDPDSPLGISHGCVEPDIEIKNPTTGAPAFVGEADNPRGFLIRLAVTGEDGSGIAGLTQDDFSVELEPSSGPALEATIINAMYVQDNYWLFVSPPDDSDGAQTGQFYDLSVTLGPDSDTQNNAILYVERRVDKLIVLDQSASMADNNRINAARNAAVLMTYELADNDQGAYVRFSTDAVLEDMLAPMDITQTFAMANHIIDTDPTGNTSIGDGLKTAAAEEDAHGNDEHVCWIVLLSDGYENAPDFWADVEAQVTNNECYMDVVGFGPTANEALLQQIAASSIGGGFYDFAPVSGDVPIDNSPANESPDNHAPAASNLSWQNYLSRIYDAKSIRAAGRQRIMSGVGNNQGNPGGISYPMRVDPTTDELVVSIAWQTPVTSQFIRLYDPNNNEISLDHQTVANTLTAEVWRVPTPMAGEWKLVVNQVLQQFHVSASARTLLEMHLFAGVPQATPRQGVEVPILATLGGQGLPITGADVLATVSNPGGVQKDVFLYDDGNHGDMQANDGVYGNWYTQTTVGETTLEDPTNVTEGQEPQSRGSYMVEAQAKWEGLRREAQTSFFLVEAEDEDEDRIPDWWEEENGMDPTDPNDGDDDPDGDGLSNTCEWNQGTKPNNSDTDGGGESDGSEVPNCVPGAKDPLNPADDDVQPIRAILTTPQVNAAGQPYVELAFAGLPDTPIQTVDIYRRSVGNSELPWQLIADDHEPPDGVFYRDSVTYPAPPQQYRVVPSFVGQGNLATSGTAVIGSILDSGTVNISLDPYAPVGSIVIQEGATTTEHQVTLLLAAEDNAEEHGASPSAPTHPPGTPTSELMMRISTDSDFEGVPWQSYQSVVNNFDLGAAENGDFVTVYVQFKDQAGNVSDLSEPQTATIQYVTAEGNQLFMPIIPH